MINLTDRIFVCSPDMVDASVRAAISLAQTHLNSRYGLPSAKLKWDSRHAFHKLFDEKNIIFDISFDERFLLAAFDFTNTSSRNEEAHRFFTTLETYLYDSHPPGSAIASIKQGIKTILVELWNNGVILLPTVFHSGTYFQPIPFSNELCEFIQSYEQKVKAEGLAYSESTRMSYYMLRILWATSWRTVEDVNLEEFSDLHRAQRLFISGAYPYQITTSPIPWTLFLTELLSSFPNRVRYNHDQLKSYSHWIHGKSITEFRFIEFQPQPKTNINKKEKRKARIVKLANNTERLKTLSLSDFHEDALRYFKEYKQEARGGVDWLNSPPIYPGREHVLTASAYHTWRLAIHTFLHHRKHIKGYESDRSVVSALNILADYLFLYLPWWKELYPYSQLALPHSPKDFTRYAFIYRSTDVDISELPVTFLEIVKLRRGSQDSQNMVIKCIQRFFSFIEAHFSENMEIAGPDFRSPIFDEFDIPKSKKRGKTSKVVFPKYSYGYLINYGYAVEAFGQYLLQRCMEEKFSRNQLHKLSTAKLIDAASLGFIPFIQYRGKLTPVTSIPNVFTWTTRCVRTSTSSSAEVFIPHLTTLRLLAATVEIGLRVAGLRWLDRRTWDKNNVNCPNISDFSVRPTDQYVYSLHVNTDKKKEKPWDTNIVFRVRALLLREEQFQLSIDEYGMNDEVPYQNRSHSRFGKILPLFRSASCSSPISDNSYQKDWVLYMIGFQEFFTRANGSLVAFIKIQPTSSTRANPKIICKKDNIRYCPISTLAISTPHACRASFATNRQGILETSEIAELLGHADPVVTEYYQSPRAEDLKEKLEQSDRALHGEHRKFDRADAAYIRPDLDDSALVRSFKADREDTIANFGFIPPTSLWSLPDSETLDEEVIEGLRNGPMSLIRFRETHICPVGEECPVDIVQAVGGFKRCGLCPLALKCIDHLPAIAAKKNALLERIKYLIKQKNQLEAAKENRAAEAIWEELELDTNELLGWQLSEEILVKMYAGKAENCHPEIVYHAERPDIVRHHLQQIVKKTGPTEFLLHRIAEANAYPSLQSPQVQAVAAHIRRRLLAGQVVSEILADAPGPADVSIAAKLLKTVMQANQLSIEDMSERLINGAVALPSAAPLRIGDS
nr:hypothetical protein [uncultured Pseudogulbenkiania sp.]